MNISATKVLDHPLAYEQLILMRDEATQPAEFRAACKKLTEYVFYEALANAALETRTVQTPLTETEAPVMAEPDPVVIGIWRAGQIMVEAATDLLPKCSVKHLGVFRDESTHQPEFYYENLDDSILNRTIFVVDPMLATGGSAKFAMELLLQKGVDPTNINLLCLIASPEGVKTINEFDNRIKMILGAVDEKLNENAYIVPGLGDAGDRINN